MMLHDRIGRIQAPPACPAGAQPQIRILAVQEEIVIETAGLKLAKEEIKRLNDELEQRVLERTSQLMLASEALREAQAELAHVNRVTTM